MLVLLMPDLGAAAELKVATWNVNWLTLRPTGDPGMPDTVAGRAPEDIDRLRGYADRLAADVVAFEEVDGPEMAARLFPPDRYALHLTADHVVQRVGIAVRRGIAFTVNPDLTALDLYAHARHHLRSGADITLELPGGRLRVLAVHLKAGCHHDSERESRACETLRGQLAPLQGWVAQRREEGVPFLLLGDFNREMDGNDPFFAGLSAAAPLLRPTAGRSSPCWGGTTFIDHILAGGAARAWVEPDSLRVQVFRETGAGWRERLSDHCPVSVRLRVPDP